MGTVLSPRAAYDLWAGSYPPEPHNPLMAVEQSIVDRLLGRARAIHALDVGTGSGRYLPLLAARARFVVGVDLSMAMLARNNGGRRIQADACSLPFRSRAFGLVNASLMVGDVADLDLWARELSRVLCRSGHLIYSDFHPSWTERGWQRTFRTADGAQHVVAYTPHTIEAHLSALEAAGLHIEAVREPRLQVGRENLRVVAVFHAVKAGGPAR